MTSTLANRPTQYRAKAQEARQKSAAEPDEGRRQALLSDAELWERMAEYEQRHPSDNSLSYYPREPDWDTAGWR
jgi:hypothetical protein